MLLLELVLKGLQMLYRRTAPDSSHNSGHRYPPPKCHPGTRLGTLTDIMKWVDDRSQACSVFWLKGPAGAGKSAIAQTIAEQCTESGQLASSFFFAKGDPMRGNANRLFTTIAYRLAHSIPQLKMAIDAVVTNDEFILDASLGVQLQRLIAEPFLMATSAEPLPEAALIIIDGLDECEDSRTQQHILSLISTACTTYQVPVHFLIASRPEPQISESFGEDHLLSITWPYVLDESPLDMTKYFVDEFDNIYKRHHRAMAHVPTPWPSHKTIEYLVTKASGQFIYAATVLKFVDHEQYRPTDRLDIVLGLTPSNVYPFSELDALYEKILSVYHDIPLLRIILAFILDMNDSGLALAFHISFNGCSSSSIEATLLLKPGDVNLALYGCHSVVVVPDSTYDEIRIPHASLVDFLRNKTRSKKFFIERGTGVTKVMRADLKAITQLASRFTNRGCYKYVIHTARWAINNFSTI